MDITNLTSMDITNLTSMDIADNNNNVPSVLNRPSGRTFSFIRRLTLFISYRLSSVTDSSIFIRTALAIRSFRLPVPASRTLWRGWLTV